ncbi:hypothetical protein LTR91_000401 [Friedmanniomyces endolithicus]|uniref:Uncharacterized protein n=1 Tax=Friedmanniomyces endolithicus TaxID=329885 RepID=A0AAN6R2Q6_9PEZI|nr:hypothetical protein LTS09_016512 [Friedmanniomyces endolithicus]KAK0277140.1 hypothetical protein LTR35_010050 [Friedmanniomyces endolithicus]KAK0298268.1 hypothetical protein LTS00_003233 [Friedmanniomyces endolithicus]KAK0313690.1 hypothetical protein LTR01_001947 [Friedmanniomyces endolithicus]KAK0323851.1 hypothetical protein LTR82_004971 [Friedmanniomyces endolithicus]
MDAIANFGALFSSSHAYHVRGSPPQTPLYRGRLYKAVSIVLALTMLFSIGVLACSAVVAVSAQSANAVGSTSTLRLKLAFFWCTIPSMLAIVSIIEASRVRRRKRTPKQTLIVSGACICLCILCAALWADCNLPSTSTMSTKLCPAPIYESVSGGASALWTTLAFIMPWLLIPVIILYVSPNANARRKANATRSNACYLACGVVALRRGRSKVRDSNVPLIRIQELDDLRVDEPNQDSSATDATSYAPGRQSSHLGRPPSYHDENGSQGMHIAHAALARPPSYHTYQE